MKEEELRTVDKSGRLSDEKLQFTNVALALAKLERIYKLQPFDKRASFYLWYHKANRSRLL